MAPYPQPFRHSAIAHVWGDLIVIGSNDLYEIRAYTADGALARIVRRAHDVRSPTRADLEDHLDEQYADRTEEERARVLAELEDMPLPGRFPAFGRILTDSRGSLWVEDYQLPGEPTPAWTVLDADGRVLGLMDLTLDLRIFEIGENYILGSVSDDLGIERVQLWPLERSESLTGCGTARSHRDGRLAFGAQLKPPRMSGDFVAASSPREFQVTGGAW